jgi:hypothetical protein
MVCCTDPRNASLLCRVVPLFRGYTGCGDEGLLDLHNQAYNDYMACTGLYYAGFSEDDEEVQAVINFGRPLQPTQQLEPKTSDTDRYWALMVARFRTCQLSLNE